MSVKIKISKAKPYVWHSEELCRRYKKYSRASLIFGYPAVGLMLYGLGLLQGVVEGESSYFIIAGLALLLPTLYCMGVYTTVKQINSRMNVVDE